MRKADREREEALTQLRGWLKPGDTVYTILDHVSSSGMSRAIRVVVPYTRYRCQTCNGTHDQRYAPKRCDQNGCDGRTFTAEVDHLHPNYAVGKLLGLRHWKRNGREQDALVVGGCGMDMGFHLVYELSHALYGGEYCRACSGHGRAGDPIEHPEGTPDPRPICAHCHGTRYEPDSGYLCLGKGKCPSNYHVNHRDRIACPANCRRIKLARAEATPDQLAHWPAPIELDEDTPEAERLVDHPFAWLALDVDGPLDATGQVCQTCKGRGEIDNPEGPERWDLRHFDGYAIRHKWL